MAVSSKLHLLATAGAASTVSISGEIQFFTEALPSTTTLSAKLISDELSDFTLPGSGGSSATFQSVIDTLRQSGSSATLQGEANESRGSGTGATFQSTADSLRQSGSSATFQGQAAEATGADNTVEFGVTAEAFLTTSKDEGNTLQFGVTADAIVNRTVIVSAGNTLQFNSVAEREQDVVTSGNGLIIRGAELHSTTLEGDQGGEIELARKIFILNTPTVGPLTFASTSPADVGQTYRIEGVSDFNLTLIDEVMLNGTFPVETLQDFAYIERVTKIDGPAIAGDVVLSAGGLEIGSLNAETAGLPETTEIVNILADVPSNPEIERVVYEKFFLYNDSENQITVTLKEQSDPGDCTLFAIDPMNNSDIFSAARDLRPVDIPFSMFSSVPKTFILEPGDNRGVWLRVRLEGGSLVTSKRYQMKICEVIRTSENGGFGQQGFGQQDFGGSPDILAEQSRIITLIGRHAGGLGLVQPLSIRSSHPLTGGGNPLQFIELRGAKIVEELAFEPDPVTFRDQFYYNTRINQLFRKIQTVPAPVWKSAR